MGRNFYVLCASYGPVAVGFDGERLYVNPRCTKWTTLERLVNAVPIEKADKRLLYLLSVPRGAVTTYSLYAEAVGISPRQVGRLMASNPYPVLLPCHRVVYSNGGLGGYSGGGVEVKRALLEYEGALCDGKPCRIVKPHDVDDVVSAVMKSLGLSTTSPT